MRPIDKIMATTPHVAPLGTHMVVPPRANHGIAAWAGRSVIRTPAPKAPVIANPVQVQTTGFSLLKEAKMEGLQALSHVTKMNDAMTRIAGPNNVMALQETISFVVLAPVGMRKVAEYFGEDPKIFAPLEPWQMAAIAATAVTYGGITVGGFSGFDSPWIQSTLAFIGKCPGLGGMSQWVVKTLFRKYEDFNYADLQAWSPFQGGARLAGMGTYLGLTGTSLDRFITRWGSIFPHVLANFGSIGIAKMLDQTYPGWRSMVSSSLVDFFFEVSIVMVYGMWDPSVSVMGLFGSAALVKLIYGVTAFFLSKNNTPERCIWLRQLFCLALAPAMYLSAAETSSGEAVMELYKTLPIQLVYASALALLAWKLPGNREASFSSSRPIKESI